MGTDLIRYYHEKVKKEWKIAFWSAFFCFLLIHFYKITNYLPNHDTVYNFYSTQSMPGNGRWFLQYACGISSYFDLPWINGLLCAVYLGITTAAVVALLEIHNPVVIVLCAGILVGTPATTETLFFGYTADGYMLGLAFSAIAAYLSCKKGNKVCYFISGLLLCLSCAIYQSCVSFAVMCCICYLVLKLLNGEFSVADAWRWIGKHVILYGIALVGYYVLWKLIMHLGDIKVTSYQGVSSVGQISVSSLINACVGAVVNIALFFVEWNILEHPISVYAALNIAFLLCFAAAVLIAIKKSAIYRSPAKLVTLLFCLAATVPVLYIWMFVSPGVSYRPMMLHGICLYYILALILFDKWIPARVSTAFAALIAVMVFNFALIANISYFWMNKCYEKTYYLGTQLMNSVVAVQQEEQIDAVAFVGSRQQEVYSDDSLYTQKVHVLNMCLEEDLLYDHAHTYLFLENTYGLDVSSVTDSQLESLETLPQVQQMPVWPAEGSSQILDGILVVKIGQ